MVSLRISYTKHFISFFNSLIRMVDYDNALDSIARFQQGISESLKTVLWPRRKKFSLNNVLNRFTGGSNANIQRQRIDGIMSA